MKNVLFIQFYIKEIDIIRGIKNLGLLNGFSDTYNFCKNIGDFVWVDQDNATNYIIPFSKGTVFISAFFIKNLVSATKWAKENPDIKFVVGGPVVLLRNDVSTLPNLFLERKSVEEYFNIPDFSNNWELDISYIKHITNKFDKIQFSYTIDSKCYWNKCTFCNYSIENNRKRKTIDFSFIDKISFDGIKHIRFNTPGLTKNYIEKIMNKIIPREDVIYNSLIRCDKPVYETLEYFLDKYKNTKAKFQFETGAEYPSNRILEHMQKGINVYDIRQTLSLLKRYENITNKVFFMTGWPYIIENDLFELLDFCEKVKTLDFIQLHRVFCFPDTAMHEMYKDRLYEKIYEGGYYRGYVIKLTEKELELSLKSEEALKKLTKVVSDYYCSLNHTYDKDGETP